MKLRTYLLLAFFLVLYLATYLYLEKNFVYPFNIVDISKPENKLPVEKYLLLDLTGIVFGVRRISSDIAWIQVLQYYGTPEEEFEKSVHNHEYEDEHHHHERCHHGPNFGGGKYYDLLKLCQRTVRLDPYFYYAYIYGSASLAWNLNRDDEGIKLLDEGIKNCPKYWQFYIYKMAIIYKKLDKYKNMVYLLEKVVKEQNCPLMVKAILANIYKKAGEYQKSLQLWSEIYKSGMSEYYFFAKEQISEIKKILYSR